MAQAAQPILLGKGEQQQFLLPGYSNRHGVITGATGTGKTVTLQVLTEGFSELGVPVFLSDVKGDLSGLCAPIKPHPKIDERVEKIGLGEHQGKDYPVTFWDIFGERGHPVRTTVSEMGPLLLTNLLQLNDTQEGVLNVAFRVADEQGLLLLDLKDLRALLTFVAENAKTLSQEYGYVSRRSVAAIQRRLLVLDQQGAEHFFGEPALDLKDMMRCAPDKRGIVNILAADKLINHPRLYATFLLWLLAELFEELPEVGDPEKPKLVFFFDEAHLLFKNAPKALLEKVEQVVRLIRSKGVGVFFVTQSPLDIPDSVLGQLGNRIQHALRAYTPKEKKAIRAVAQTFRANPKLDTEQTITQLGVGEALISTLQDKGIPAVVDRVLICPPHSQIGPVTETLRKKLRKNSSLAGKYDTTIDRESAFEALKKRAEQATKEAEKTVKQASRKKKTGRKRQSSGQKMMNSIIRSVGYQIGRQIVRGIMGGVFRGR